MLSAARTPSRRIRLQAGFNAATEYSHHDEEHDGYDDNHFQDEDFEVISADQLVDETAENIDRGKQNLLG